jgi:hypothetical protein
MGREKGQRMMRENLVTRRSRSLCADSQEGYTMTSKLFAFVAVLVAAWIVVFATQVQAQTTDEQKQALIGEWSGVWPGIHGDVSTLIIHEIDTEKKKARCTYTSPKGTFPVLAEFTPGPNPKIEFKLDYAELRFVLHKDTLQANVAGEIRGTQMSNQTDMKKK